MTIFEASIDICISQHVPENMTVSAEPTTNASPLILTQKLGVWTLLTTTPTRRHPFTVDIFKSIAPTYAALRQNLHDVYSLAPGLLGVYLLISMWESVESAVFLYLSSRVLLLVSRLPFTCRVSFASDAPILWHRWKQASVAARLTLLPWARLLLPVY